MLIGAHVSTAGGLPNAIDRGVNLACESIQIFNQSPRMWRPTRFTEDDFADFREAMDPSPIDSVVIHAVYLINPAGSDRELRRKAMTSLTHALWVGAGIGAAGVVLHPGALKQSTREAAMQRAVRFIGEALAESEGCDLLIENNAGSKQLLGLGFDEIAEIIDRCGGGPRLGLCIDSCHLHASGFDVRSNAGVAAIADEIETKLGLERLRYLHLNDSRDEQGSLRDRHASIGKGEIGQAGFRAFLSEPRFQDLPAVLETPGPEGRGPDRKEVQLTRRLWKEGLKNR